MPVKSSRRAGGKSKPKKKVSSSATKKINKKKAKKTSKTKVDKKVDKAEIKKAVDEIPGLIAKEMTEAQPKETAPEEDDYLGEKDFLEIKAYLKPKKTYPLQYHPKKDKRKKFIWIGVISISMVIFSVWIWNVWTMFYDVSEYKKGENGPGFLQNVKSNFNEAIEATKLEKEGDNNLQKAIEETEGKQKLEEVLGMLIAELNATSTTSTVDLIDLADPAETASSTQSTTTTLEKIKQILTDIN